MDDVKFDFDDILIKPSEITGINSRTEVNVFNSNNKLPLFTAPMDTVVDDTNYHEFYDRGINIALPRGVKSKDSDVFISFSLNEFINEFINKDYDIDGYISVLIDIANGHMRSLMDSVEKSKIKYGDKLVLMVGNIANPKTYVDLSLCGADYVRVGIGNGNGCLTTQQTGVGYPMASLVMECYLESIKLDKSAKIVADGGMKKYSDIIKAIYLGADYVMVGSLFNKCFESCSNTFYYDKTNDKYFEYDVSSYSHDLNKVNSLIKSGCLYKEFRGMSTKEVQKKWGAEKLKTSEGISKKQMVEYTLDGWLDNFTSYLKSAMSYTDSKNLSDFTGKNDFIKITNNALNRFKK